MPPSLQIPVISPCLSCEVLRVAVDIQRGTLLASVSSTGTCNHLIKVYSLFCSPDFRFGIKNTSHCLAHLPERCDMMGHFKPATVLFFENFYCLTLFADVSVIMFYTFFSPRFSQTDHSVIQEIEDALNGDRRNLDKLLITLR